MGKLVAGVYGNVTGKIGGVVTFVWKGINAARSYAIPANPNTSAQQASRSLWASLVAVAKLLLSSVIQVFWDPFAVKQSGFNRFMQVNRALVSTPFDPLDLKIAEGNLEGEEIDSSIYTSLTGNIATTWTPTGLGNGEDTDIAKVVVYDEANGVAFISDDNGERVDASLTMDIGTDRVAANLKVWLFFYRGTGSEMEISNSVSHQAT